MSAALLGAIVFAAVCLGLTIYILRVRQTRVQAALDRHRLKQAALRRAQDDVIRLVATNHRWSA